MELDILYRLCILVGFLSAGLLALFVAVAILALRSWYHTSLQDLDRLLEDETSKKE